MHPLDGSFAKIARGESHYKTLEAEIAARSNQPNRITLQQEFDPDAGTIKVTFQNVPEFPLEWGLIAADALQNLRTALNYLAWELAVWNLAQSGQAREPTDRTQFPINSKGRAFSDYMVADLHPDHVARVQRLQPNGPDHLLSCGEDALKRIPVVALVASHPLAKLATLTNDDKHRALQVALLGYGGGIIGDYEASDCVITDSNITLSPIVENGTEWASFDVTQTGPQPEVKMQDTFNFTVAIGGRAIGDTFEEAKDTVLEIVRSFQPVF